MEIVVPPGGNVSTYPGRGRKLVTMVVVVVRPSTVVAVVIESIAIIGVSAHAGDGTAWHGPYSLLQLLLRAGSSIIITSGASLDDLPLLVVIAEVRGCCR